MSSASTQSTIASTSSGLICRRLNSRLNLSTFVFFTLGSTAVASSFKFSFLRSSWICALIRPSPIAYFSIGKAQRSVVASYICPVCLSLRWSICSTARAARTPPLVSTVALKLSRKAEASRYSRRASLSNSRISATRRARTRMARRRATPRSSCLRIGHDSESGVEVHGIVVLGLDLKVLDLHVVRRLLERHQQRQ